MRIFTGNFDSIFFLGVTPFFELRNLPKMKDTTQNCSPVQLHCNRILWNFTKVIICRYAFLQETLIWSFLRSNLYPFWTLAKLILCNSDETGFLSDCPSFMLGIAIRCIQHSQAMLERGVCEPANSFFHYDYQQLSCISLGSYIFDTGIYWHSKFIN